MAEEYLSDDTNKNDNLHDGHNIKGTVLERRALGIAFRERGRGRTELSRTHFDFIPL